MQRFLPKIVIDNNGCWIWQAGKERTGYGRFKSKGTTKYAHRVIYEFFHGIFNKTLSIDHLCRNRSCVNPIHLEAVTLKENIRRAENQLTTINSLKTNCIRGHQLSGNNLYVAPNSSKRVCKKCRNMTNRIRYWRNIIVSRKYHKEWKRKQINLMR